MIIDDNKLREVEEQVLTPKKILWYEPEYEDVKSNPNAINDQIFMNAKKNGSQTKVQALAKLIIDKKITKELADSKIDKSDIETLNQMIVTYSKNQ